MKITNWIQWDDAKFTSNVLSKFTFGQHSVFNKIIKKSIKK